LITLADGVVGGAYIGPGTDSVTGLLGDFFSSSLPSPRLLFSGGQIYDPRAAHAQWWGGGGRQFIAFDNFIIYHSSQMCTTKYMPVTRKKRLFDEKIWANSGGSRPHRPPLNPPVLTLYVCTVARRTRCVGCVR